MYVIKVLRRFEFKYCFKKSFSLYYGFGVQSVSTIRIAHQKQNFEKFGIDWVFELRMSHYFFWTKEVQFSNSNSIWDF